MRRPVQNMVVVAAALLALAACQDPDVGQSCPITWGSSEPKPNSTNITADYFETGNTSCDNLVCIMSRAADGSTYARGELVGYCSKPCSSNQDCFQSETGLVCRQVVLDDVFIAELEQRDPALKEQYLGEISRSSYCAVPR